ncbi:MAG: hypothetical protein GSR81_04940 [Desulfurococcales archaeon]|nr:hypothetical protein [Desulfurococcales archaeon]
MDKKRLLGGLMASIGLALLIGALIGSIIGVKTSLSFSGEDYLGNNKALIISLYSSTSEGTAVVEISNASQVFYISNVTGDPRSLVKALTAFNINATQSEYKYDMRLGLVYGTSKVEANSMVLSALPSLSKVLKFNIKEASPENGVFIIRENMTSGEALLVFALGQTVSYNVEYNVSNTYRLPYSYVYAISVAVIVVGILVSAPWKKTNPSP